MTLFAYIDKNIDRIKYDVRIGIVPCCLIKHFHAPTGGATNQGSQSHAERDVSIHAPTGGATRGDSDVFNVR